MTLDFNKLVKQMQSVGRESVDQRAYQPEIVAQAKRAYALASMKPSELLSRLKENSETVLWPSALPVEPFGQTVALPESKTEITVVAVDGSQIMPSQHEVHNCFLLNIGFVQLSYGSNVSAILESYPRLYHETEDLYPLVDRRRMHIDELYVSLERNLLELEYLVNAIQGAKQVGKPVVAMVDGSLMPWSVERMPDSYKRRFLEKYIGLMQVFVEQKVPIVGYISHSRSCDIVNDLRVAICPYESSRCKENCGSLNEEDFPCSTIWPLLDRTLLQYELPKFSRSSTFLSGANVLKHFPDILKVCFLYINIGDEVARIEFPRWLLSQKEIFDTAVGAIIDQVKKGKGFPVALAEAHHLAVIKGPDRQRFFELLAGHLVSIGAGPVTVSPKEKKKRVGLV